MPRGPAVDEANQRQAVAANVGVEQPHRVVDGVHQASDHPSAGPECGQPTDLIGGEQRRVHDGRALTFDDPAQLDDPAQRGFAPDNGSTDAPACRASWVKGPGRSASGTMTASSPDARSAGINSTSERSAPPFPKLSITNNTFTAGRA